MSNDKVGVSEQAGLYNIGLDNGTPLCSHKFCNFWEWERDREISNTHWSYHLTYLEYRFFLPPFQNSLIWSASIASNLELIERLDLELLHSCWAIHIYTYLSLSLSHELATSYMGIINTVSFFLSPVVLSCSYVQAAIMKKLLGLPFLLQHTIYIYIYIYIKSL